MKTKFFSSTRIAMIAIFGALAAVLYTFAKFPIPVLFAPWLQLKFSDIPALIGTFALGPLSGAIIVVVEILLSFIMEGTTTGFVGEISDIITGVALVVPAGLVYKYMRNIKGALLGLLAGMLTATCVAMLANWLILIPYYVNIVGIDVVSPLESLFPNISEDTFYLYYLLCSVLPFNLMRFIIASGVTLLLYKRISFVIKKISLKLDPPKKEDEKSTFSKRGIVAIVLFAVILIAIIIGIVLRILL